MLHKVCQHTLLYSCLLPLFGTQDLNHGACVAEILAIQRQGVEDLAQRKPYVFPGVYLGLVLLCMLLYWFYLLPATW